MKIYLRLTLCSLILFLAGCDSVMEDTLIDPGAKAKARQAELAAQEGAEDSSDAEEARTPSPSDEESGSAQTE